MKKKNKVRLIILPVLIISIIFVVLMVQGVMKAPKNIPITSATFIEEMKSRGYNIYSIENSQFENMIEGYLATKDTDRGNQIRFNFYVFASNEDARNAFFASYSGIKSKNAKTFEFLNHSGWIGNTQYYTEIFNTGQEWWTDMYSVDNTFLLAQSNQYPMVDSKDVFEAFGYSY